MIGGQSHRQQTSPNAIVSKLNRFAAMFPDSESSDYKALTDLLKSLSISLRTTSFSFVQDFLKIDGVELLASLLDQARRRDAPLIASPILEAFRTLLNSSVSVRKYSTFGFTVILSGCSCIDYWE